MSSITLSLNDIENKRKAKRITSVVMLLILLLLLIPWLVSSVEEELGVEMIYINFSAGGSQEEGAKHAAAAERAAEEEQSTKTEEQQAPSEEVIEEVSEEVPEIQPEIEPLQEAILTADNDEIQIQAVEETVEEQQIVEEIPDPVAPVKEAAENIEEVKEQSETDEGVDPISEPETRRTGRKSTRSSSGGGLFETGDGDAKDGKESGGRTSGDGTKDGSGGKGNKGDGKDAAGDGTGGDGTGTGTGTGYFQGDGVLTRRIIKTPDELNSLIKESGSLVFKICVNKQGRVTFAEFDFPNSTIKDPFLAKKALDIVKTYKWESDYSAPVKECGRFKFNIKM